MAAGSAAQEPAPTAMDASAPAVASRAPLRRPPVNQQVAPTAIPADAIAAARAPGPDHAAAVTATSATAGATMRVEKGIAVIVARCDPRLSVGGSLYWPRCMTDYPGGYLPHAAIVALEPLDRPLRRRAARRLRRGLGGARQGRAARDDHPPARRRPHRDPADRIARSFAAEVASRSGGRLLLDVRTTANASLPVDYAAATIADARAGDGAAAAVPAFAWSEVGVRSLEPLDAPLLVASDAALDAAARDAVAVDMLGGLRGAGHQPLGLVPTAIRVLEGFGAPIADARALAGAAVRARPGSVTWRALEAAGARPRWVGGFAFEAAARGGSIAGAAQPVDPVVAVARGTFTANVPLGADAVTLSVGDAAWARLGAADRSLLAAAAAAVRDGWAAARQTVAGGSVEACADGQGVAVASAATVATLGAAFAPVVADIAAVPGNRARLDRLAAIGASLPPARPHLCMRSLGVEGPIASGDQHAIDGVWRRMMTRDAWRALGLESQEYPTNGGLHTWTIADGRWLDHDDVEGLPPDGSGTLTLHGGTATVVLDGTNTIFFEARYEMHGDELRISDVRGDDHLVIMWAGTWRRVG